MYYLVYIYRVTTRRLQAVEVFLRELNTYIFSRTRPELIISGNAKLFKATVQQVKQVGLKT